MRFRRVVQSVLVCVFIDFMQDEQAHTQTHSRLLMLKKNTHTHTYANNISAPHSAFSDVVDDDEDNNDVDDSLLFFLLEMKTSSLPPCSRVVVVAILGTSSSSSRRGSIAGCWSAGSHT